MVSASPMIAPTVMRGLSEANGSWKMICMSRRSERRALLIERHAHPRPANHNSPELGSISRRMQRPVVDLPQPDSPTTPSVSPFSTSKLTWSTAWTLPTSRPRRPPFSRKSFTSSFTRKSGSVTARSFRSSS